MNPRWLAFFKLVGVLLLVAVLIFLFPPALEFVEVAARDLRYFWWLILLFAFALWLIWGLGRKKK